ncbi:MAG: cyclic nucleotide-binding domain-containing protein [Magnetococcus sp. DMHC-6]
MLKQEKLLGKSYQDREIIIQEGDVDRNMYVVQFGEVEVFRKGKKNDEELHLAFMKQGDVFGEMSFLDNQPRSASVRAVGSDVRVLTIDARMIMRRVHEDPFLILAIFKNLSGRLRESNDETSRIMALHNQLSTEYLAINKKLGSLARIFEESQLETFSRWQVANVAIRVAEKLKEWNKFLEIITPEFIKNIGLASTLYDVGKGGIDPNIFSKKGCLTSEERVVMRQQVAIGSQILKRTAELNDDVKFIRLAVEIAEHYQERYDGYGYKGLQWERVPLSARILTIVDVYQALVSDRPYRAKYSHTEAIQIIKEETGSHFDPEVSEAFLAVMETVACQEEDKNVFIEKADSSGS